MRSMCKCLFTKKEPLKLAFRVFPIMFPLELGAIDAQSLPGHFQPSVYSNKLHSFTHIQSVPEETHPIFALFRKTHFMLEINPVSLIHGCLNRNRFTCLLPLRSNRCCRSLLFWSLLCSLTCGGVEVDRCCRVCQCRCCSWLSP